MIRDCLDKYCVLLNKEVWEDYSAYGILVDLKHYLPQLKSEILLNSLDYDNNKKTKYLDYIINEILNCTCNFKFNDNSLNEWLIMFNITLADVVNSKKYQEDFFQYLDLNFSFYVPSNDDLPKDKIISLQNDFMQYFCKIYAMEVIKFCNDNKPEKTHLIKQTNNIKKPFKDEYLKEFCKSISNDKQIYETCFDLVYEGIIHFVPYFENEIMENLLLLKTGKKDDYLNFAIDTVKKTEFSDYNEKVIEKWLEKYNSPVAEFPHFNNENLKHWLKRYYNGYADDPKDYDYILDVQIDFYCYAAGLEAQKMIAFLESKKSTTSKNIETQTESTEKIKWIGKPSQLGFIIGKLAELGYIDAPKKINRDINYTQFAKQVKNTFDVETTESTLSKYLNLESEKGQETNRKFNENGFNIPSIIEVS